MGRVGNQAPKRVRHSLRLETKRARTRLVTHPSITVDHVKAIGPARVGALGHIVEVIDDGGKLDTKLHHAQLSHLATLVESLRARKYHVVIQIVGILPHIACVRFANVNHVERHPIAILLVELIKSGNLPPKGRSRVTAEHEHHGFLAPQR
jgi:hypothetical protein